MAHVRIPLVGAARAWRDAARALVLEEVPPEAVSWSFADAAPTLLDDAAPAAVPGAAPSRAGPFTVPRAFVALADAVVCHSDPERFALLYAMLWRLRTTRGLLEDRSDAGVARLRGLEKAVHRDMHKMKAFVRFREVEGVVARRRFVSWFEPEHFIVEATAEFFARRFGDMDWLIATPKLCVRFDEGAVQFLPGVEKPEGTADPAEALWRTYFSNIFNPARLKVKAMQAEMPKKYWRNLPEAEMIPEMIASAERRVEEMRAREASAPPARAGRILEGLRMAKGEEPGETAGLVRLAAEAAGCTRCPLHAQATQVVFGEGPEDAELMFVGEQPGDQEDLAGRPFVGPAGQLFDQVLEEAEIDRRKVYVTNAVKHFKFEPRGKRRIHQKPNAGEVSACRWWIDAERALIRPKLVVALGATAALALTGSDKGILKRRGRIEAAEDGTPVFLTVHPSFLLRLPDADAKAREIAAFRADLRTAAGHMAAGVIAAAPDIGRLI